MFMKTNWDIPNTRSFLCMGGQLIRSKFRVLDRAADLGSYFTLQKKFSFARMYLLTVQSTVTNSKTHWRQTKIWKQKSGKIPRGWNKDLWHPAGEKASTLCLKLPTTDYALSPQNKSSQKGLSGTQPGSCNIPKAFLLNKDHTFVRNICQSKTPVCSNRNKFR